MSQVLGHTLPTETGRQCVVERLLGGGGQGEVYQARVDGQSLALKWYFPQQATPQQRALLEDKEFHTSLGRPIRLVTNGTPVQELLGNV